jgi:F-type H+-transporting ATPase subunit delta
VTAVTSPESDTIITKLSDVLQATSTITTSPAAFRKIAIVLDAMQSAPRPFTLFLASVIRRGRQLMLGPIADEYRALVDVKLNRVRAGVTVAREINALARSVLVEQLSKAIGKDVIAGFSTDPALLGGVVVRIGDRVYDGSVRKQLAVLRNKLLAR